MDGIIQKIFILIFFIYPVIIHSKDPCPTSRCGDNFLMYPFKLQTDQPPNNCKDYINLRCNEEGQAVINLPSSGDFIVTQINYYAQQIDLSDPQDCLPGRLMTNFSVYPLEAFRYDNYTYYMCPRERLNYQFYEVHCLSNNTNATIATNLFSSSVMENSYGCKTIVSSLVPVLPTTEYHFLGISDYLQLTWNASGCRDCEDYGTQRSGDSKSKWTKFFGSPLFISSVVVLATFFGIACLLRLVKLTTGRPNTNNTTANNPMADAATAQSSTTGAPPLVAGDTPAAPASTANGTEHSCKDVKSCTELVVLSESQGTLIPSGVTCSICLEEYHGKDRVRFLVQCGHCFHAECVDQWLQKNTTCPVCRTSLSNF